MLWIVRPSSIVSPLRFLEVIAWSVDGNGHGQERLGNEVESDVPSVSTGCYRTGRFAVVKAYLRWTPFT